MASVKDAGAAMLWMLLLLLLGAGASGCGLLRIFNVAPPAQYEAFGDSITCGFVPGDADSSGPGQMGLGCRQANGYPYLLAKAAAVTANDFAIPGDQACDIWPRQVGPEEVTPTAAYRPVFSLMIGTNDAAVRGAGAYEAVFRGCELGFLTWLAIPAENKVLPDPATVAGTGWSLGASGVGTYATADRAGSVLRWTITTYGGPIYLWHGWVDREDGAVRYTVDGGVEEEFSTAAPVTLRTQNGTTVTAVAERITGVAEGTHVVDMRLMQGRAYVYGMGTPPKDGASSRPVLAVGSVPLGNRAYSGPGSRFEETVEEYTTDTKDLVQLLAGDGLHVVYAPNHTYLTGNPAEYTDAVHVTPLGAEHLAEAFGGPLDLDSLKQR